MDHRTEEDEEEKGSFAAATLLLLDLPRLPHALPQVHLAKASRFTAKLPQCLARSKAPS